MGDDDDECYLIVRLLPHEILFAALKEELRDLVQMLRLNEATDKFPMANSVRWYAGMC